MEFTLAKISTIGLLIIGALNPISAKNNNFYIGVGVSNLETDVANSDNYTLTAGYDIYQWNYQSSNIEALTLSVEAQYSDSLSSTDNVNSYSLFAVAKAYTSENFFFKVKQGFTDFPDAPLTDPDAESSHFGPGIGLGYQQNSWSIELDYIYPNKTIDASVVELSYKLHF